MRRLTLVSALALAVALVSASWIIARAAAAKTAATTICGEIVEVVTLPKAPPGLVATESWTVGDDCKAHRGPIEFVDPSTLGPIPADVQAAIGTAGQTSNSGGLTLLLTSTAYASRDRGTAAAS